MKRLIKIIFYFSPAFIKKILLKKNQQRQIAVAKERLKVKVSKEYVHNLFEKINIDSDVMVHSSLMDIGKVEGGYKTIVNELSSKILESGHTLLVSALPYKGSSVEFLKNNPIFDVSKAEVATGVINEYFADLPEAARSLSPTHSVVAVGTKADYYTSEHHLYETPFSEKSPYYKLAVQNGKILMVGATLNHLTFCHLLEDLIGMDFPVKVYGEKLYKVTVVNEHKQEYNAVFKGHNSFRSALRSPEFVIKSLRNLPSTEIYPLGCSELIILDAKSVIIELLKLLRNGQSIYGKVNPSKKCIEKIEFLLSYYKSEK